MTRSQILLILIPIAYLCGSIPFGLFVGLAKGVDPRKAGSGNIGATNVARLLGKKYFLLVFTLDVLKGMLPTLAAGKVIEFNAANRVENLLWIAVAFAAILGHVFSVFLKFKGGKGVATTAGVVLGIFPYFTLAGVLGILSWVLVVKITRYVSVGSMAGAFVFCFSYIGFALARRWPLLDAQLPFLCFAILVPILIVYKHRANIARLRAGTENPVGAKPVQSNSAQ